MVFLPFYVSVEVIHDCRKHFDLKQTMYYLPVFLYYVEPPLPTYSCLKAVGKKCTSY